MEIELKNEIGLDPENWEDIRDIGYQMVDDMVEFLKNIRKKPAWKKIPEEVKNTYKSKLPQEPSSIKDVYEEFKQNIFEYAKGNVHPRFFSWVEGNGTAFGALSDFMASTMNSNVAIGNHSALYIENLVISWCKEMMGFSEQATGMLVSGASIANITSLIVARNAVSGKMKEDGLYSVNKKLVAYCSTETHNCVTKAIEVIGLGNNQLRKIGVNDKFEIDINLLIKQIEQDKKDDMLPFCIIGNAGTVNTGAFDDLNKLLEVVRTENMWLHIDGAFGALAKLVPEYQDRLKAIEEADSLAFDFHKWLYVNYEVACVLIKHPELHRKTYASPANYLLAHDRGLAAGPDAFSNYGMELSRGFKALKVWMSLKENGINKYKALINQNIQQSRYLGQQVEKNKKLELITEVSLNIVCFRYVNTKFTGKELNELNKEILMRLHESGVATPSYTLLNGIYAIRVANTNHRTRKHDLDLMLDTCVKIGDELSKEFSKMLTHESN